MDKNELITRTKEFAHRCVKFALALPDSYLGRHIKNQIIRSSTSVAANYRAACHSQTKAWFISKISIVIEECDETEFWLEFTQDEKLVKHDEIGFLLSEAHELTSIFVASRKTAQKN